MQNEIRIELDCMHPQPRKSLVKPRPKFGKFVRRQTSEDFYENMGSIFVLIMIIFVVFVYCMAEWEKSLNLDYSVETEKCQCN